MLAKPRRYDPPQRARLGAESGDRMKYYIPDIGETAADAQPVPKAMHTHGNPEWAAKQAAEWYHQRRDGWEASWPIAFVIIDGAGEEHRFYVSREMVPQFYVTEAPAPRPGPGAADEAEL